MSSRSRTDRDWEIWGKEHPYFGVLTDPKYLDPNLNDGLLREFFASGEEHVEHVYRMIRHTIRRDFDPARVLDYGCGIGRLVIPFGRRAQTVIGIDVSQGMLEHARVNCKKFGIGSARLMHLSEIDSLETGSLDLIHSVLVFQHIPVARGEMLLRRLVSLLAKGGLAHSILHILFPDRRFLTA